MTKPYFEIAADRRTGARSGQHGAFHTAYLDDGGGGKKSALLAVMADSVEGQGSGQVACSLVIPAFNRNFERAFGSTALPKALRSGVAQANRVLARAIEETPALEGMACTFVAATLVGSRLHWVSVGDGHLWLLRDGKLRKLNEDHTYGGYLERMRAQGIDEEPEPGLTPDMLVSALTGAPLEEVDCPDDGLELRAGDRVVLASPALRSAGDTRILQASGHGTHAGEALAALLSLTGGDGPDGATVIVADVRTRESRPAAVPAASQRAERAQSAPRNHVSTLLDVATGVLTLVLFVAAATGTWFGLGLLDEFRNRAQADAPVTTAIPSAPVGDATGTGSGLTFGAPAPPPGAAIAPRPAAPEGPAGDGLRDALQGGGEGPAMVMIPAGQFEMGSGPLSTRAEERPRHPVTVEAFAIGQYEVTVAQYQRFTSDSERKMPDVNLTDAEVMPITRVTWDDAYAYTRWLSRQTGKRYRLPSEAEWEYAASGGATTPYWWGMEVGEGRAHCFDCGTGLNPRKPTRVGRFPPNPFGVFDTAGNVAEWVHDCWHPNYREAPADGGVWEGGDCTARVVRGGAFSSPSPSIRTQTRVRAPADQALDVVGFRVAREP